MGRADLKRAASKVRIRILEINDTSGEGYVQAGDPQARLVHFTDQSVLLEGGTAVTPTATAEWKTTAWRNVTSPVGGEVGLPGNTTAAPFYAYSNDWNTDVGRETYIELKIPFSKNGVTRDYFYHVPVTPYAIYNSNPDIVPHLNKMERDFLYDIAVKINYVGVADNPPVTLEGNYTITDWSEQNIIAEVFMFHYLMVTPNNTVMPNTNTVTLDFLSSVLPVQSKDLEVSYTYVDNATGQPTTEYITSGSQYATITIDNTTKKITVTSAIPVNYIPKDITFTVYTQPSPSLTIEQQIVIRQLPATYFTVEKGEKSSLSPDGTLAPNLNNRYMYAVTTLAPAGSIIWGFPPLDENGYTQNTDAVANMVSPSFMMASQLGATKPKRYNESFNSESSAVVNCADYWEETIINGVKVLYDDWRLPTVAEINFIIGLQDDPNSSSTSNKKLLTGLYYWGNGPTRKVRIPGGQSAYPYGVDYYGRDRTAHVRCVRDVKD